MQRIQRKVGRLMPNRAPNEADIESMLRDFNDSDQMLEKIHDAAQQWRDAWTNILGHQLQMAEHMHSLYRPLGTKSSAYGGGIDSDTPPATLERCAQLQVALSELKTDMMEEVKDIERKLMIPAKLARDSLKPMKTAIKKRDDKKADYTRQKSRTESLQNKQSRTDREASALNRQEGDLTKATHEYEYADEALRSQLPRLNAATFSLLPHLLTNQIILQNNLIGNLYTVLNQYSHEQGYPDPPPDPEEVIPVWDAAFTPLRSELESGMELLRTGKAVHLPMRQQEKGSSLTGLGLRNKVIPGRSGSRPVGIPAVHTPSSRPSSRPASRPGGYASTSPRPGYGTTSPRPSYAPTSPRAGHGFSSPSEDGPPPNLASKPSYSSLTSRPKTGGYSDGLAPQQESNPWGRRTSTASYASSNGTSTTNTTSGHDDYFGRQRITSNNPAVASPNPAAGKKKPPPPPPKKIGSFQTDFVIAMYDFDGLNAGDLTFREGDRIRVTKKTNSSHDWWEGEVNGQKGSFPANYCK